MCESASVATKKTTTCEPLTLLRQGVQETSIEDYHRRNKCSSLIYKDMFMNKKIY